MMTNTTIADRFASFAVRYDTDRRRFVVEVMS